MHGIGSWRRSDGRKVSIYLEKLSITSFIVTADYSTRNRGRIAYIGEVDYAAGIMIGVELENPVGKNDGEIPFCQYILFPYCKHFYWIHLGTVKGRHYFTCKMGHGLMLRASELHPV
jgi:dynactin complex subunit